MLTDTPPRKANHRERFLESDGIKTLDLPHDGSLLAIAQSIEVAMKCGTTVDVRRACAEFVKVSSDFYKVPACGIRVLAARPLRVLRTLGNRTVRRLQSLLDADPGMDEDCGAEGDHVLWDIPQHPVPRVLPPSGLSEVRVPRFMAHSRILRASRCALPPCAGDAAKKTILGTSIGWSMADRLAANESG